MQHRDPTTGDTPTLPHPLPARGSDHGAAGHEPAHRPVADRFGPYRLVAPLAPSGLAERWLAIDERAQVNYAVHRLHHRWGRGDRRRGVVALQRCAALNHVHILPIRSYTLVDAQGAQGEMWVVTPYTGAQNGLLTLDHLPAMKGGRLLPAETVRGTRHLLEASEHAHAAGVVHGPVEANEVLVDRHGSLCVEFYGLRRLLSAGGIEDAELLREDIRDEVRSIVALAYRLLTGMPADEPRIRAGRLVKKLDRALEDWLDHGLDPVGGFDTASQALAALPGTSAQPVKRPRVEVPAQKQPAPGVLRRLWAVSPPDDHSAR